jgi:uncharacterized protein involved in exopolysaccharide biosynthesis
VIDSVKQNLRVRQLEGTDGVDLEFVSSNPVVARQVVNTVAQTIQTANARSAQQQARLRRSYLGQQLLHTDSLLADAQSALSRFRSECAVFSSRDQFAAQQTSLRQVEMRREELAADQSMYQSFLSQLRRPRADGRRGRSLDAPVSAPGIAPARVRGVRMGMLSRGPRTGGAAGVP